jgi:hypothetical protein
MQRRVKFLLGLGFLLSVSGLPGCGSSPDAGPTPVATDPEAEAAAEQAQAMAERLQGSDAVAMAEQDRFDPFADAEPLPSQLPAIRQIAQSDDASAVAQGSAQIDQDDPVDLSPSRSISPESTPIRSPATRQELLNQLNEQLTKTDDPAFAKAIAAVGLSLAEPTRHLDPAALAPLRPGQREQIKKLHAALTGLMDDAALSNSPLTREHLTKRLDEAFLEDPVRIENLKLCRSVKSFGVYEPFNSTNFLGGQNNKAIVYVEIDNFKTQPIENDKFEVRLSQELILYNESDGLAVWRSDPVEVTDTSRRARRDFYLVQMITLPARLANGMYRLKVRVTDQHGESVDETTMKLNIVADPDLLREQ